MFMDINRTLEFAYAELHLLGRLDGTRSVPAEADWDHAVHAPHVTYNGST